ncbi:MAG: hypothetical protein RMX60_03835, partial [Planktomarina sp.]|nr:hypothetical protein [Planktomarina sp.]
HTAVAFAIIGFAISASILNFDPTHSFLDALQRPRVLAGRVTIFGELVVGYNLSQPKGKAP